MTTAPPLPVGRRLLDQGVRQGHLLPARGTRYAWARLPTGANPGEPWELLTQEGHTEEWWVVASQNCDIASRAELRLELVRAYWTTDRGEIRSARLNSARKFLLLRRPQQTGGEEGLIADATVRSFVEKEALVAAVRSAEAPQLDAATLARFSSWLARRYDRPAIPDAIVRAVHKPLVEALRELAEDDPVKQYLDFVEEIRFSTPDAAPPFRVSLLLIYAPGASPAPLSEADVQGWLDQVLTADNTVRVEAADFRTRETVSLADYLGMTWLTLDEFSTGVD